MCFKTGMRSVDNNRCLVMHGRASCDNVYIILQRLCTFASILLIWLPIALVYKEKVATTNWYHLRDGPGTSSSLFPIIRRHYWYIFMTFVQSLWWNALSWTDLCCKVLVMSERKKGFKSLFILMWFGKFRRRERNHQDGLVANAPAVEPCTRSVKDAPLLYRQQEGWETFKMETAKK